MKQDSSLSPDVNSTPITPGYEEDEDDKELRFCVDLPGVKVCDLELTAKENVLVIDGARRFRSLSGSNAKKARFRRALILKPDIIDATKMTANLADGVLTIVVPKKPKPQPIRITVTTRSHDETTKENQEKVNAVQVTTVAEETLQ